MKRYYSCPPTITVSYQSWSETYHFSIVQVTNNLPSLQQTSNGAISRGPSPNRGASVPDSEKKAIPDQASKREWQKKRGIDPSKQVRIVKLSHMRYQHPDLNKITTFLRGKHSPASLT